MKTAKEIRAVAIMELKKAIDDNQKLLPHPWVNPVIVTHEIKELENLLAHVRICKS